MADLPTREELRPSKVIAVHSNYRSRAAERGRSPKELSYFFKPPSSLSRDGDPIVRPQGCELLCYEGEIAIVIGKRARRVSIEEGASYIAAVAPSNDVGVFDLRWADRGSNVMAKGQDGFTPLGPLGPAAELDLGNLTIRTRLNGEVVQEDSTSELIFPFAHIVADLSRFLTLEPGDVILTGTPANARPMQPGDVVEVEVVGVGSVSNPVVEADEPLAPIGAMPKATPEARALATGVTAPRSVAVSQETLDLLGSVTIATLSTQLQRHGIRQPFLEGLKPTRPDLRMIGFAHTVRYVAAREDFVESKKGELNAQRRAAESVAPGEVVVIEARGLTGAGTMGDIYANRIKQRGAAGIVTDGALRDTPGIAALDMPTYYRSSHASVLGLLHYPLETNVPITVAGVLVLPGDVIVGDAEGVVVVPAHLAESVAKASVAMEDRENWALERVLAGESTVGIYPMSDERLPDYEADRAKERKS